MKSLNTYFARAVTTSTRGFVLPFTMLMTTLILLVTGSSMLLLSKQFYFSKIYKQSQLANYAADDALACALAIDDGFSDSNGLGIFPYDTSVDVATYMNGVVAYANLTRSVPVPTLTDITCGQSEIFATGPASDSKFSTSTNYYSYTYTDPNPPHNQLTELGITSFYNMRMDLGLAPGTTTGHLYRCAKVTVNKTPSFRQIISQGYAQCDNPNGTVERAVVNTTASN